MYNKGISVIIFGYNSTPRLDKVLNHIARQKLSSDISWEVILMDNGSTDNTMEYGKKIWSQIGKGIPLKGIIEFKRGLIYSRITGIKNALYEYMVFVDDDNVLDENYLQNAYNIMSDNHRIGVIGGKNIAMCDADCPDWFAKVEHYFAVGEQGIGTECISSKKGFVWGAGMVVRKSAINKLIDAGWSFSERYFNDKLMGYGDDYELCLFIRLAGYEIYYSDKLQLYHIILHHKVNIKYIQKISFYHGYASIICDSLLYILNNNSSNKNIYWLYFKQIANCFKNIIILLSMYIVCNNIQNHLKMYYYVGRLTHLIKSPYYYFCRYDEILRIRRNLLKNF